MAGPSASDILGLGGGASQAPAPVAPSAPVPTGSVPAAPSSGGSDAASILGLNPAQLRTVAAANAAGITHRGFLDRLAHAAGRNVVSMGEEFIPSTEKLVTDALGAGSHPSWAQLGHEWGAFLHNPIAESKREAPHDPLAQDIKQQAVGVGHDVRHPLRNPVSTALDVAMLASGGLSAGARIAAAGRVAEATRAAEAAGEAYTGPSRLGALTRNPSLTTKRTISVPGEGGKAMDVQGQFSKSGLGMAAQKASDAAIQRLAGREGKLGERAENTLQRRAAKWRGRSEKATQVQLRAEGNRVMAVGRKLKLTPVELRALRIVAETVPYERVLGVTASRLREAERSYAENESKLAEGDLTPFARKQAEKGLKVASDAIKGHQARLAWTQQADEFLARDVDGRPMISPDHPELQDALDAMSAASKSREGLLKGAQILDDAQAESALSKQVRMAAGAKYVAPTAGRLGFVKGLAEATRRRIELEKRYERRIAQTTPTGFGAVTRARTPEEAAARLDDLERERARAIDTMADAKFGPVDMREVRFRNRENTKARRQASGLTRSGRASGASGVKAVLRPTVKEERRQAIESDVADAIDRNPDHPTLQRWQDRDAEIEQLRHATRPESDLLDEGGDVPRDYGTVSEYRSTHPSVEKLGSALSEARAHEEKLLARRDAQMMPTGLVGAEDVEPGPGAIHVGSPTQPPRFGITGRVSTSRTLGHTRQRGSLKVATGRARQLGMERNDVTELLGERQHEAVGLASLKRLVDDLRPAGTKLPRREDDVFMWTDGDVISSRRVDPATKNFLQGVRSPDADPLEEEAMRSSGAAQSMKNAIFQAPEKLAGKMKRGSWELDPDERAALEQAAKEGKGVFVPRRLLGDRVTQATWKLNPKLQRVADDVNNAGRLALIYLKINYPIVQGLSNVALNLIQQGVYAPQNLLRAATLSRRLGPDLSAMVDDAVEQGFAGQVLAGRGKSALARGTQKVAHVAGLVADKVPRRAAWLHEAQRLGYSTPEQIRDLLTNPDRLPDLIDVTQRAKESIIDFGDLGPVERDFVRHLIFVYPWMKGSTVYAGRFLRDHPVQAAALANLGETGSAINQQEFGARPSYDMSLAPFGAHRAIDFQSLNPFSTPVELGRSLAGWMARPGAVPSEPLSSYASPAVSLAIQQLTGRDEQGFPLKGSRGAQIRDALVAGSPISQIGNRLLPSAVTRDILGTPRPSKTFPNQSILGRFLLGGLYPRTFDQAALNQAAGYQKAPTR